MYQVSAEKAWRLVVTHDDTRARELYDDFSYFEKNTWLYPARDLLFYSSDIHGNLLTRQRMQVFKHLMEDPISWCPRWTASWTIFSLFP